jgi:hypothetical protein
MKSKRKGLFILAAITISALILVRVLQKPVNQAPAPDKETSSASQPLRGIASVSAPALPRLTNQPSLKSDPTVAYGAGDSELIDERRREPDDNHVEWIRVYHRKSKAYPYLRVLQVYRTTDQGPVLEKERKMAGDHVLVTLKPGASQQEAELFIKQSGATVRSQLPLSGLLLVEFDPRSAENMDHTLQALRTRTDLFSVAAPNYFAQVSF